MLPSPHLRALVLATTLGVTMVACSSPVEVAAPPEAEHPSCTKAIRHWPTTINDEGEVPTDPSSPAIVAWGEPAVIARCGMPPLGPTEDQCIVVDDVDWVAEDVGDGTRLTTFGRDPALEVIVPQEQGPGPLLLPAFTEAAKELPRNDLACS